MAHPQTPSAATTMKMRTRNSRVIVVRSWPARRRHFAWSARIIAANCSGVLPPGSAPESIIWPRISGELMALAISICRRATRTGEVPAGTKMPCQP